MSKEDLKIVEAMEKYGGSFIQQLAKAYRFADDDNQSRIKNTWPFEWGKYKKMANGQ